MGTDWALDFFQKNAGAGYQVNNKTYTRQLYADDAQYFDSSLAEFIKTLRATELFYAFVGLRINRLKSGVTIMKWITKNGSKILDESPCYFQSRELVPAGNWEVQQKFVCALNAEGSNEGN